MANVVTNRFLAQLLSGEFNFPSADIRAVLLSSGTPTRDTNVLSELVAGIEGSRVPLSGLSVTEDDTLDFAYLDADNLVTPPMPGPNTVTWLVLYHHLGADNLNTVIGAVDIPDMVMNGSIITIGWASPAAGGILKLRQGP